MPARLGDERSVAWSLHNLGLVARARGGLDQAGALFQEALAKRWSAEDRRGAAAASGHSGTWRRRWETNAGLFASGPPAAPSRTLWVRRFHQPSRLTCCEAP